jgi:hypothetical protein
MNIELAYKIVQDALEYRKRWGNLAGGRVGDHGINEVFEALETVVALYKQDAKKAKKEATLAARQLTASKAREAKLKKKIIAEGKVSAVNITGVSCDAESVDSVSDALKAINAERAVGIRAAQERNELLSKQSHMLDRLDWLECLEAAGVDNWQGMEEAIAIRDKK